MELHMPSMFAEPALNIFWLDISQTLLTSFVSLIFFVMFVVIYNYKKKQNEAWFFVAVVDMLIETMDKFFGSVSDKIPVSVKTYILFLFVYILWNNIFWVFLDMFTGTVPFLEEHFRPVSTDIYFNAVLAVFGVLWAISYWIQHHGFKFFERYFPLKWVWIVKMDKWYKLPIKILDVFLWLFIGLLELIGEFTKMLSLTLRLFWNIFAWAILLAIVIASTIALLKVPFFAPLIIFIMELFVGFLQAFVFSLLVLIYFKMAEESH